MDFRSQIGGWVALVTLSACGGANVTAVEEARLDAPPVIERPLALETSAETLVVPSEPVERAVTIGAGGDVLIQFNVAWSAREHGGFTHVFGALRTFVADDEIAFVNLETPLSERVPVVRGGEVPVLSGPPEVAAALSDAGIDVASVANNHSYDQTAFGLNDTLVALEAAGIMAVGAAPDVDAAPGPVTITRGGLRVAFVAYTRRVNQGALAWGDYPRVSRFDLEEASALLRRSRADADIVVLSIHWSRDFIDHPWPHQRRIARALVDAGADVIIGHGPHVIQEVERLESERGDALCAYSLGNLVSNQGLRYRPGRSIPESMPPAVIQPSTRDGVWLRTRFVLEEGRLRIERVEGVPLWTHNNFLRVATQIEPTIDIRIERMRDTREAIRSRRRPAIADALGDVVTLVDE